MTRTSVWSAPGRVNLIGEHTDYNGGLALPVAIDLRVRAAVSRREDDRLTIRSRQRPGDVVEVDLADVRPGVPAGWASYVAGVFAVLRRHGHRVGGADVTVDGAVPIGAGLSSSAALECAVAAAADDVFGLGLPAARLAALAQEAENTIVGVPCGGMDQLTTMLARADCALLLDAATDEVTPVPLPDERALVVADTGVRHALADGHYAERRGRCERAAEQLGVPHLSALTTAGLADATAQLPPDLAAVTRHVVTENERVRRAVAALAAHDWAGFGAQLTASHHSLREDFAVSCPELDLAVEALLAGGADGARMTGAGFGGSVVASVAPERVDAARYALVRAFRHAALAVPTVRLVRAVEGAFCHSA